MAIIPLFSVILVLLTKKDEIDFIDIQRRFVL